MKRKSVFISVVIVILVVTAIYFFSMRGSKPTIANGIKQNEASQQTDQHKTVRSIENGYVDPDADFSFTYPPDSTVNVQGYPSDRTIVVMSSTTEPLFQLETKAWNDPDQTVTLERIRKDAPLMDVRDPQPFFLDGVQTGLAFVTYSDDVSGDVLQVWFISSGRLYQFTAPIAEKDVLIQSLTSFVK